MDPVLQCKPEIIILLEGNRGNVCYLVLVKDFLGITPKVQFIKGQE